MPNRRPWTTWRLYVFREVRRKNSRSSGVGRGQFLYTLNWRAVRGFPIEAPHSHPGLERRLKGRDQLLKLGEGQAGEIQELRRAGSHLGKSYIGHSCCLLSWEAQYIINRDNLNSHA